MCTLLRPVVATPLSSCALDADLLRLGSGCESLLRSSSSATSLQQELGLRQPYCDPSLVNNPKKYAQFLWRLHDSGMLQWSVKGSRRHTPGILFVAKSNGDLRLIFDTRFANTFFEDPPSTALPTAGAFSRIESEVPKSATIMLHGGHHLRLLSHGYTRGIIEYVHFATYFG